MLRSQAVFTKLATTRAVRSDFQLRWGPTISPSGRLESPWNSLLNAINPLSNLCITRGKYVAYRIPIIRST